jgi:WD40 repeat protein
MLTAQSPSYEYQVGGSLPRDALSYVRRQADEELFQALLRSEFCYVLNSRQMGKSSLWVQTMHRLQAEGICCGVIDLTAIGTQEVTPEQWYASVVGSLTSSFQLQFNIRAWWRDRTHLSLVSRLSEFLETVLLVEIQQNVVIFIDEIDSLLSLDFPTDDFFALIRAKYNKRAQKSSYKRLTFALLGVATPPDLIADKNRTPFNIGRAIELKGFELHEAMPLMPGLKGIASQPEALLAQILNWTGGQPFLTQKLCKLALTSGWETTNCISSIPAGGEGCWVEQLVLERIIDNWETQDEPEHLRTIRDRILRNEQRAGRLLGIYQQILTFPLEERERGTEGEEGIFPIQNPGRYLSWEATSQPRAPKSKIQNSQGGVATDDSPEQMELLLSGLVIKRDGKLTVRNPIYAAVFNKDWVDEQLENLRPYAKMLTAWLATDCTDSSRLLRGQALREALDWATSHSLSNQDYQFLAASQELDKREIQLIWEAQRTKEVEARLEQQKRATRLQQMLLGAVITAWQESQLSEIEAIATSSEALFTTERRLDALIAAIKAKRKLQQLGVANPELENRVQLLLEQAVYGASEFNRLSGHQATVYRLAISPDAQTIASASLDNEVKLWQRDGTLVATLPHNGTVWRMAFSPDSKLLACASGDGTVKVWQQEGTSLHNPKLLHSLEGHSNEFNGVAFSPDGEILAASGENNTVKLWDKNGILLTILDRTDAVRSLSFSLGGEMLVSGSGEGTIRLWKKNGAFWASVKLLRTFQGHSAAIWDIEFSPDGEIFASASMDKSVKLWRSNAPSAEELQPLRTLNGHASGVECVDFSPDGQIIVTASDDRTIKFWSKDGKELRTFAGHRGPVWDIDFSPEGTFIASLGVGNAVKLWQPKNIFLLPLQGHDGAVYAAAFAPDGKIVATASTDGTVKLWRVDGAGTGALPLQTLQEGKGGLWAVAFSPDSKVIAVGGEKTVKLWHKDGRFLGEINAHKGIVRGIAWSPDGKIIASASTDGTVKLWQPNGVLVRTLKLDGSTFWSVVFSPDGKALAAVGSSGTLAIWKPDGTLLQAIDAHQALTLEVSFSPDGKTLASASTDGTVKLWKLDPSDTSVPQKALLLRTLKGHIQAVLGVSFSPDGEIVATASLDNTVKLWNKNGILLTTLTGHTGAVPGVSFSPDGTFLVSGSMDQTAILWNVKRILNTDPLAFGCDWVRDYLRTNADVKEEDRHLCDGVGNNSLSF